MGNENSGLGCSIVMAIVGTLLSSLYMGFKSREANEPYLYPSKPGKTIMTDVNKDGLEDIVHSGGEVEIKQKDGSYIPLREYLGDKKFFYQQTAERNTVDNLNYKLNTGRYTIEAQ